MSRIDGPEDMAEAKYRDVTALQMWSIGRAIAVAIGGGILITVLLTVAALWYAGFPSLERKGVITASVLLELLKLVFATIAGVGGTVALVVAYRRQKVNENTNRLAELANQLAYEADRRAQVDSDRGSVRLLNERFASAADQLGSPRAAVRVAGVYALARLADDWPDGRQTCVDVLCAYLRMPYTPPPGEDSDDAREPTTLGEREVRDAIIRAIRAGLSSSDPATTWRGLDIDLSGAAFDTGSFDGVRFEGGKVSFSGARFIGPRISFERAEFAGGRVSFDGADFASGRVSFSGAVFAGGEVSFRSSLFRGADVSFDDSRLVGGRLNFSDTRFLRGLVTFHGSSIGDGQVKFGGAQIIGGDVIFDGACMGGGRIEFEGCHLKAGRVSLGITIDGGAVVQISHLKHYGGVLSFSAADVANGQVVFSDGDLSSPDEGIGAHSIVFGRLKITGGEIEFRNMRMRGGALVFSGVAFMGGRVVFRDTEIDGTLVSVTSPLYAGGVLDFSGVTAFSPSILLDPAASEQRGLFLPSEGVDWRQS